MMLKSGAYKITCRVTGKIYVGSTTNLRHRWTDHKVTFRNGNSPIKKLREHCSAYGSDVFVFEVLEYVPPDEILVAEKKYLDLLQPFGDDGFNTRRRPVCNTRGRKLSPEHIELMRARAKPHTKEARDRMREAAMNGVHWLRGKTWPEEYRAKIRRHSGEAHHYYGKQREDDVRRAISVKNAAAVLQVSEDGTVIARWESAYLAARDLGITNDNIYRSIKLRRKTRGGLLFQYETPESVKRYHKRAS